MPHIKSRIDADAATIDTRKEMSDRHDGRRDGMATCVLNHVNADALAARLGA